MGQDVTEMHFAEYFLSYVSSVTNANMVMDFVHFYMFPRGPILYFLLVKPIGSDFRDDCKQGVLPHTRGKSPQAWGKKPGDLEARRPGSWVRGGHHEYAAIEKLGVPFVS